MSEFWERKMKTCFTIWDFDHDGVVTFTEFTMMAEKFFENQNADSEGRQKHLDLYYDLWQKWTQSDDDECTEALTFSMFIKSMKIHRQNPDEFKKSFTEVARDAYSMLDVNNDGYLQEDEHRGYFESMGMSDTSFVKGAFEALDLNHDGKVDFEEYLKGYFDFMLSDDENSRYNSFFGPLL